VRPQQRLARRHGRRSAPKRLHADAALNDSMIMTHVTRSVPLASMLSFAASSSDADSSSRIP
jgi:hypothetical protein